MSKKKKKRRQKKSGSRTQPAEKRLRKEKSFSSFLRQADGCLPTDSDSAGISHDIIFVESGHLLTREMRNLLNIARYLQSMEKGSHLFGDDIPIPSNISYTQLSQSILEKLSKRGVPAHDKHPFLYKYEILAPYLSRDIRINEFYNAFIELMYNEWKIIYARKLFVGFGFENWAKGESVKDQPHIRQIFQEFKENSETMQTGFTFKTARGLWFASECIIRIRAQWDKLLKQFVLEKLLGHKKAGSLSFEKACAILNKYREQLETEDQKECLDALLSLAGQTEKLRKWRDDDVHYFSQAVFGVLEKRKTSQSLGALWDMVIEEHNRVREGVIAAIGMVLLGLLNSPTYYASRWPAPTRYIDFGNTSDVDKHNQLVEKVGIWQELQKAIRETDSSKEKASYTKQHLMTSVEIDQIVYELYGLKTGNEG